ncbi:hypothetical protein [Streptomyces phaeochromogenes]|uniref:hypothetical protein n=1 Tax=Streptomyces phaeochromogenes TaxID=1923 RepID=UPI003864AADE|nr:hypothetical protein OHB08_01230 [Streptomyces phaeochromogenes]
MSLRDADCSWLPDHQLHVVETLAHIDHTIERLLRLTHDYTEHGTITFTEVSKGDRVDVVVQEVAPLPQAVPRLVADALTQLRAALEHTLYAEVEAAVGRPLTEEEAKSVEMPATCDATALAQWFGNRRRRQLGPLNVGTPLAQRIERLQPFQRRNPDEHPLRLLAVYTNVAKHRAPAVAAARLGAVQPDDPRSDLAVALPLERGPQPGDGLPLREGDVLASAPRGARIPFSVWPTVSLQRPHTGMWAIAANELELLEEWVRTVAIPILVTGRHEVSPLPPHLDITVGHRDMRAALATAGRTPAVVRSRDRIAAATGRAGLVEFLAFFSERPEAETVRVWLDSLDDTQVVQHVLRLRTVSGRPRELIEAGGELITEARRYKERTGEASRTGGAGV